MLIKKKERCWTQNRKISHKFCFYAIIFLSVIFQTKSGCFPIQIWFIYHSWKFESCSFNRGRVTALCVEKWQVGSSLVRDSGTGSGSTWSNNAHGMHRGIERYDFKQTLNKIINLPQEHSNYTSCHELCPYDVNIARPVSVSWFWKGTDTGLAMFTSYGLNSWQEV